MMPLSIIKNNKTIYSLSFIFLLGHGFISFGQIQNNSLQDSLVRRGIERTIFFPECETCDSSGTALLEIFKQNDIIIFKTVWWSKKMYTFWKYKIFTEKFNSLYGKVMINGYKAIVPVYCYNKELIPEISKRAVEKANKKIEYLKKHEIVLPIVNYIIYKKQYDYSVR